MMENRKVHGRKDIPWWRSWWNPWTPFGKVPWPNLGGWAALRLEMRVS